MSLVKIGKPELLAPAGREDVFYAVLEAGADAVYLSGKQFNMRRHRKDYHFSDEKLAELISYAHKMGKKVYVTVNILIGNSELEELEGYLLKLELMEVDALIIQDFAVVEICKRLGIKVALHASTMMNVNSVEQALFLKKLGFERVVTSRDITLDAVRRIREGSKIEVEYFVHGDMCSVQSGQCHQSGQIFGKSSNRGQCMKPCRWKYDLLGNKSGAILAEGSYLLAAKDLCVLGQVPDFIRSGCNSFKIEGRMKPANMLSEIVAAYREAIDKYWENPVAPRNSYLTVDSFYKNRVRDFSSGYSFKNPNNEFMDYGGKREPFFISYSGRMHNVDDKDFEFSKLNNALVSPKISLVVGNYANALVAIENGVDRLIASWEGILGPNGGWELAELKSLANLCREKDISFIVSSPRILAQEELADFFQVVERLPEVNEYLLTGVAPVKKLKCLGKILHFDSSCNILNIEAVNFFKKLGASSITPAAEAGFDDVACMIENNNDVDFEILAHGPITSMVVEHCLIAMATQKISKKDFCRMPCELEDYLLQDVNGNRRLLKTDRYCRNHIFLENELSIIYSLDDFLTLGAKFWRIDARFYDMETTVKLIALFKEIVARKITKDEVKKLLKAIQADVNFCYGAYLRGIVDNERSLLSLKSEEACHECK